MMNAVVVATPPRRSATNRCGCLPRLPALALMPKLEQEELEFSKNNARSDVKLAVMQSDLFESFAGTDGQRPIYSVFYKKRELDIAEP